MLAIGEEEITIIVRRLAMFQKPSAIARQLRIPEALVDSIRKDHLARIEKLKRSWKDYAAEEVTLVSEINRLKLLSDLAQEAADTKGGGPLAIRAMAEIRAILNEQKANVHQYSLGIMDAIERGSQDEADRMMDAVEPAGIASLEKRLAQIAEKSKAAREDPGMDTLTLQTLPETDG